MKVIFLVFFLINSAFCVELKKEDWILKNNGYEQNVKFNNTEDSLILTNTFKVPYSIYLDGHLIQTEKNEFNRYELPNPSTFPWGVGYHIRVEFKSPKLSDDLSHVQIKSIFDPWPMVEERVIFFVYGFFFCMVFFHILLLIVRVRDTQNIALILMSIGFFLIAMEYRGTNSIAFYLYGKLDPVFVYYLAYYIPRITVFFSCVFYYLRLGLIRPKHILAPIPIFLLGCLPISFISMTMAAKIILVIFIVSVFINSYGLKRKDGLIILYTAFYTSLFLESKILPINNKYVELLQMMIYYFGNYMYSFSKSAKTFKHFANNVIVQRAQTDKLLVRKDELEKEIKVKSRELVIATNSLNSILENIHYAIFCIGNDFKIKNNFSSFAQAFYGIHDLAGMDFREILFTNAKVELNTKDQCLSALLFIVNQDEFNFSINEHNLIRGLEYEDNRTVTVEWYPFYDKNDNFLEMLIFIKDITDIKLLDEKTRKQSEEIQRFIEIVALGGNKFLQYAQSTKNSLNDLIASIDEKEPDVNKIFRYMHTIKGNSRTYKIKNIMDITHEAECFLDDVRKGKSTWDYKIIHDFAIKTKSILEEYQELFDTKLKTLKEEEDNEVLIMDNLDAILGQSIENNFRPEKIMKLINNELATLDYKPIKDILSQEISVLPSIAKELGKLNPIFTINDNNCLIARGYTQTLKNIMNHLIRNGLDHGIDKDKQGEMNLIIEHSKERKKTFFTYFDNGRGLNLNKLLKNGMVKGLLLPDAKDEDIAQIIFLPGNSTADEVTNISGRGVGMEAIRSFLRQLGGDVEVRWRGEKDSNGFRPFDFFMILPIEVSYQKLI